MEKVGFPREDMWRYPLGERDIFERKSQE